MHLHFLTFLSCSHFCISLHLVLVPVPATPLVSGQLQVVLAQPRSDGAVGESSLTTSSGTAGCSLIPAIEPQIPETHRPVQCCPDCYAHPNLLKLGNELHCQSWITIWDTPLSGPLSGMESFPFPSPVRTELLHMGQAVPPRPLTVTIQFPDPSGCHRPMPQLGFQTRLHKQNLPRLVERGLQPRC